MSTEGVTGLMAETALRRAVKTDATNAGARIALAQLLFDQRRYASSLDQCEAVLRTDAALAAPALVAMMNVSYLADHQYARGVAFWRNVLHTAPAADAARIALAILLHEQKSLVPARSELAIVIDRPGASDGSKEYARTLMLAWARSEGGR